MQAINEKVKICHSGLEPTSPRHMSTILMADDQTLASGLMLYITRMRRSILKHIFEISETTTIIPLKYVKNVKKQIKNNVFCHSTSGDDQK